MSTEVEMLTARAVAPEDVRRGDYLTVLHQISELLPFWQTHSWDGTVVRVQHLPSRAAVPVQVVDVCLPLILVRSPRGKAGLVDVRRYRLARVPESFGRCVFEQLAEKRGDDEEAEDEAGAAVGHA
jgi:hypothetical protein